MSTISLRYVRDLMRHMTTYLVELSRKNDFKSVAEQPDIILSVRMKRLLIVFISYLLLKEQHNSQHPLGQLLVGAASWSC